MAVGDAGGLVDPITGEGLYYAMRSGDLASRVVIDDAHGIAEKAAAYRALLRRDFALDLEFAATPRQARFPRQLPVQLRARAHGAVHAPQPAFPRPDAGSVRRHAAVPGL